MGFRKGFRVQAWVWALLILVLVAGVVVVVSLQRSEEAPVAVRGTTAETEVKVEGAPEVGIEAAGDVEAVEETSTVPMHPLQVYSVEITRDGLLVEVGDGMQEGSVIENFVMNHTPLRFLGNLGDRYCWAYWVKPDDEQFELLVSGLNAGAMLCDDLLICSEWKLDAPYDVYFRTASGDSISWGPTRSTSDVTQAHSGKVIMMTFPERGQFLARQYEIGKEDILHSLANSAVRRFSDKWRWRAFGKRSTRMHLELWDKHSLEKASQVGPEATSIDPPSMLFGENKDMFLVVEQYAKEADQFLVAYSLEPFVRKARIRLKKGVEWVADYGRGREPNELVAILQEYEKDYRWGFAWVKYDAETGLTMERFDPGATTRNGWMVQWHGELAFYKNPPEGEFTIARGDETVVVCGLKHGDFAISEDGKLIATWMDNRFDLWDLDFPAVNHRVGYRAVRQQGTDELEFVPEGPPVAEAERRE